MDGWLNEKIEKEMNGEAGKQVGEKDQICSLVLRMSKSLTSLSNGTNSAIMLTRVWGSFLKTLY